MVVLYRDGAATEASKSISARLPAAPGYSYRLQAAYSCALADCSGSLLRLSFLDAADAPLNAASVLLQPLGQQRTDNDLFWDQIDRRFRAPRAARGLRVELSAGTGGGSFVIPYLRIE